MLLEKHGRELKTTIVQSLARVEEGRKAVHWAVVAVPKVSWEAYTM